MTAEPLERTIERDAIALPTQELASGSYHLHYQDGCWHGEVEVRSALGIHARPAAHLAQLVQTYPAPIFITKNNAHDVDMHSVIGMLTLAAGPGTYLQIRASGEERLDDPALHVIKSALDYLAYTLPVLEPLETQQ